ncbi:MAG TPA: FAD-dependent oxidoreductase [Xanthobacteraceae bacterium]|jgi:2-polyprenyl-6-methoxyphenol hydroxylase-like FAD-dependent oxidoreductase
MGATTADLETDVLIVGAGPVGLAAAIELGQRGVRCVVVERNDRVGYSPRAKTTNVRSREHLRRWGIAGALRRASPISPDRPSTVVFATRMNGPLIARFENALNGNRARNNLYSEEAQWVPQYILEEVLRQCAQSLPGVAILFETEFVSLAQTAAGVNARLRNVRDESGSTIKSSYLIGADGARSAVRDAIGSTMLGEGAFSRNFSIIFRAPELSARQIHGPAIMYWMLNEEMPSVLGPMDEEGLWTFMVTKLPDGVDPATIDAADLIRRGTGLRDLPIEIVGTDLWVAHRLVADHYAQGRVFLAGDACHLHPPFGGFGMNMGIGDSVDLGWKMAAHLAGWGGDGLLASYEIERRPVHERTMAEAVHNFTQTGSQIVRPDLEAPGVVGEATRREVADLIEATKVREFKTLGIVLGMRYSDSPIIVADGSTPPPEHFMLYVPSAHPGCLAPHLWLADGSSLYDHFGPGFALLVTQGDANEAERLVKAAAHRNIPLKVLAPANARLRQRYEAKFALIRPDQHVAWRGEEIPSDCDALIARVTGTSGGPGQMP